MDTNRFKGSIKKRLIVNFLLVSLIPVVLVAFTIYYLATSAIVKQEEESMQVYTESVAQGMDQWLRGHLRDMQLISQTEEIQSLDSEKQLALMHIVKDRDPAYETVIFTNTKGVVQAHTTETQIGVLDIKDRDYIINGLQGEDSISNVLTSATSGNRIVVVATPVHDKEGKVIGVLSSSVNFESLINEYLLSAIDTAAGIQPILIDATNTIQVHPDEALIGTALDDAGLSAEWISILETGNTTANYARVGKKSEEILVSATPIEIANYGLYFATPLAIVLAATSTIKFYTLLIIGLSTLLIIGAALYIANRISRPVQLVTEQVKYIADGDLSVERLNITNNDETGYLATNLNHMTENLHGLITQIGDNSAQVSASSEQLMASANQSSEASEHITLTIENVASGAEEQMVTVDKTIENTNILSDNLEKIMTHAEMTSTIAEKSLEKASNGNETIQLTVNQMESIHETMKVLSESVKGMGERSREIDQIVEVISTISAQTNLLALNAAIEAARAGEHGQGFAVVANEVRHLAEQSAHSAGQITQLISNIQIDSAKSIEMMEQGQLEVEHGVDIVHQAGDLFADIKNDLAEVTEKTHETSAAANDMTASAMSVIHSIRRIADISNNTLTGTQTVSAASEEQLASMQEISSAATVLANMAEELQEMILKFKI